MTPDEHCKLLGKLIGNFQSLEFILRAYLQALPSARPLGIPYGNDIYSYSVGSELDESEITSYDTLGDLIKKFNTEMKKQEHPTIDVTLVEVRDALAHGRVSSNNPDDTMRLLKFDRPDKKGHIRVVFNEQMDEAWFEFQIKRVLQAILVVYAVMPQQDAPAANPPVG